MISTERAKRVLADMRGAPILDLSPERSEVIVAEALREARAHGARLVVHILTTQMNLGDAALRRKLERVISIALEEDEKCSTEQTP